MSFYTLNQKFADAVRTSALDVRDLAQQLLDVEDSSVSDRSIRAGLGLDTLLKVASEHQVAFDAEIVGVFLEAGANSNSRYDGTPNPLILAIQSKNSGAAKKLLDAGADAHMFAFNYNGATGATERRSVLVVAIENGQTEVARYLLEREADATGAESNISPLSVAARTGNVEIAELLLARGAVIESELCEAAQTEDNPMVEWLLKKGADPNACDKYDGAPSYFAAQNNALNNLRHLLDAGATFTQSVPGWDGKSPLHSAVSSEASRDNLALVALGAEHTHAPDVLLSSLEQAVAQAHLPNTRILVEACRRAGIELFGVGYAHLFSALAKDVSNYTHESASESQRHIRALNSVEVAQFLWDEGLRMMPSEVDEALGYAIGRNNKLLAFWLLKLDGEAPGANSDSLLHTAATFGRVEIARALLEKGALVDLRRDSNGYTPLLVLAAQGETTSILKLAYAAKDLEVLASRAEETDAAMAQLLLNAGANVNACTPKSQPVLSFAVRYSAPRVVKILLQAGADVEATGFRGRTALLSLMRGNRRQGRWEENEERHKQHNQPFSTFISENQPLDELLTRWDEAVLQLLLDAGASINVRDSQGYTPLHLATMFATPRMVQMLLQAGADPSVPRPGGQSLMEGFWRSSRTNKVFFADGFSLWQFPDVRASIERHAQGEPLPPYLEHSRPAFKQMLLEDSAKWRLLLQHDAAS